MLDKILKQKTAVFQRPLRKIGMFNLMRELVEIPVNLFVAVVISQIVSIAVQGKVSTVMISAFSLLTAVIVVNLVYLYLDIVIAKSLSRALHQCKMALYQQILANPLSTLYASKKAECWKISQMILIRSPRQQHRYMQNFGAA